MTSRAFKVITTEGSTFAVRMDASQVWYGHDMGVLRIIGTSKVTGRAIDGRGIGAAPRPGGRLIVSDKPLHWEEVEGEQIPIYEYEVISTVQELPVPVSERI